jgi:hypothetical protein
MFAFTGAGFGSRSSNEFPLLTLLSLSRPPGVAPAQWRQVAYLPPP